VDETGAESLTTSGLARRYGLDPVVGGRLDQLQALLAQDPQAPTATRAPGDILADHLADSLAALEWAPVRQAGRAVDIGSGAGLPGLPLAMALPRVRFALVESASRKCRFIQRAVQECGLRNVEVVHARVEAWSEGLGRFDLALTRAVAALEVVLEYAAPLLTLGGTLVAWRGQRDFQGERRAARAAELLGLAPVEVRQVWPYPGARNRYLHLFSKVMDTPARFPRREGAAAKRPLGAE
jgi:16S rRNA (guanine527-N7)-methyltransferase